jgi:hypothetical protein
MITLEKARMRKSMGTRMRIRNPTRAVNIDVNNAFIASADRSQFIGFPRIYRQEYSGNSRRNQL